MKALEVIKELAEGEVEPAYDYCDAHGVEEPEPAVDYQHPDNYDMSTAEITVDMNRYRFELIQNIAEHALDQQR